MNVKMPTSSSAAIGCLLAILVPIAFGCGETHEPRAPGRLNVLWIVWDTVRADHMSLYGYDRPTTPKLDEWAKRARVYEDAVATSSWTVPAHASMFTGLLPTEHGSNNAHRWLDDDHETIAELMQDSGYQTYLFAANPHISKQENFAQGFEVAENPWMPKYRKRATQIVLDKIDPADRTSELTTLAPRFGRVNAWGAKASGALAVEGLQRWLSRRDPNRPWFAFLNYMEAHRPYLPSRRQRALMMTPEDVEHSFRIERTWETIWSYTFGVREYSDEELRVMSAVYDATLVELDDLFAQLIATLDADGALEDTVVVLTSDHGEHLGGHQRLDHQYSLYQSVLRVPLIVHAPGHLDPGRDTHPVMVMDLFPTILELAGIERASAGIGLARSLLGPPADRIRLAEYPSPAPEPLELVANLHPGFDPSPWDQPLKALFRGDHKLITAANGSRELFDIRSDPHERQDLAELQPKRVEQLTGELDALVNRIPDRTPRPVPRPGPEQRARLRALGYLAPSE